MKRLLIALSAVVLLAGNAWAGPQYVDKSGYAVSGYDVVSYWSTDQSSVGSPQAKAVPGKSSITADYNGAKWAFSSVANRDAFLADPAKYVPQFDGHCAYGVAQGGKVPANPHLWRIVDGKLYLNINKAVVGFWEEDIAGNISTGNGNWKNSLEAKAASTRKVPSFSIENAPVAN